MKITTGTGNGIVNCYHPQSWPTELEVMFRVGMRIIVCLRPACYVHDTLQLFNGRTGTIVSSKEAEDYWLRHNSPVLTEKPGNVWIRWDKSIYTLTRHGEPALLIQRIPIDDIRLLPAQELANEA